MKIMVERGKERDSEDGVEAWLIVEPGWTYEQEAAMQVEDRKVFCLGLAIRVVRYAPSQ
jgi:hypothetical protein